MTVVPEIGEDAGKHRGVGLLARARLLTGRACGARVAGGRLLGVDGEHVAGALLRDGRGMRCKFIGARNGGERGGGRGWRDILGHDRFLEAFPILILLSTAIGRTSVRGDPHDGTGATIGRASVGGALSIRDVLVGVLIRSEGSVLLGLAAGTDLLAGFKLGKVDADVGEGGGLLLLGLLDRSEALGVGEGDQGVEARSRGPGVISAHGGRIGRRIVGGRGVPVARGVGRRGGPGLEGAGRWAVSAGQGAIEGEQAGLGGVDDLDGEGTRATRGTIEQRDLDTREQRVEVAVGETMEGHRNGLYSAPT